MKIFPLNLIKRNISAIIILIGGSSDSLEKGALSNCSFISLNQKLKATNYLFNLNIPRRSPSIFNFKCGHLFVIGGCSAPGSHLNSGELFNLDFSKETENFKIDGKLLNYNNIRGFSCSAFCQIEGNGGFIFGGYDGNECLNQIIKIEEIEPHNANLLSPLPFGLKNATALPSLDKQKIWIIGGWDGNKTQKTILEYNIKNQTTKFCHFLPYPLECHAVAFPKIINSKGIGFIIGGFDGIGLRSEILIINLNNGNILEEINNVKLLKPKENCGATCFCIDGEKEFLAVFGGWDGYNVINDIELFEVLQESPWLRREENFEKLETLDISGRNRPAVICL
uniref:Uncharacterized protein n=1 Tax=Meloidogyne enterolobii TaxID=390850 RepID=A0A6V7XW60_MELEN|nr:unnamed protein product [Meloidogyne enterolobii]